MAARSEDGILVLQVHVGLVAAWARGGGIM